MTSQHILRVLIVDDDRPVADTLAMIVEASGHTARIAYSGEEAMIVAGTLHPDAAISNVMLPGLDGIELAGWLEDHYPECRVLLTSGHPDSVAKVQQEAGDGRPRSVLPKPVHPSEIINFLAACTPAQSRAQ